MRTSPDVSFVVSIIIFVFVTMGLCIFASFERVPDMHVYRKIKIFASKISLRVTLKITGNLKVCTEWYRNIPSKNKVKNHRPFLDI